MGGLDEAEGWGGRAEDGGSGAELCVCGKFCASDEGFLGFADHNQSIVCLGKASGRPRIVGSRGDSADKRASLGLRMLSQGDV